MKKTIGAIHLGPMIGYPEYKGFEQILFDAVSDLKAFEEGGIDSVIIENNYDIPHKEKISEEGRTEMISICQKLRSLSKMPFGISVLWNDYESAFSIAKAINAEYIRVPVFVDTVETSYGIMIGNPDKVIETRKKLHCENIQIFSDIHVKHAKILSNYSIEESAEKAIQKGSSALIVTGKWTGDMPDIDDLKKVREKVGSFPVYCGSGVDDSNIKLLYTYADGAIVSTSLKSGEISASEVNLKPYDARINKNKVWNLMNIVRSIN